MSGMIPLPEANEIKSLLADLVGKAVNVSVTDELEVDVNDTQFIVSFVTRDGKLGMCSLSDANFASKAGASLAMIPANAAEERVKAGKLSDPIFENFSEIMNILSTLPNSKGDVHLTMKKVYCTATDNFPDDVINMVMSPERRSDFEVDISGYGNGKLTIFADQK